jgi:peptidoglycan hydrolase-like protein with peptidoglycan-binding domain
MHGWVWRVGSAAIAVWLCALPVGAVAAGRMVQLAQNVPDAPAVLRANSPEQIRKAQIELRRLECLNGRIDGKLGDQTRQAVKKFWASAKQPAVEVNITDELISDLAARGDLFCRPVRPFFAIGGRAGGNSATPPFFAPGARPSPAPAPAAPPAAAQ